MNQPYSFQNIFHQRLRSMWNIFSIARIRISLIAAMMATTTIAGANSLNASSASNALCTVSLTDDELKALIFGISVVTSAIVLSGLGFFYGVVQPVVVFYTNRWIDRQIRLGKLPPLPSKTGEKQ